MLSQTGAAVNGSAGAEHAAAPYTSPPPPPPPPPGQIEPPSRLQEPFEQIPVDEHAPPGFGVVQAAPSRRMVQDDIETLGSHTMQQLPCDVPVLTYCPSMTQPPVQFPP